MKKLELPNVTLAALATKNLNKTVKALQYSMRGINFGDAVFVSHKRPNTLSDEVRYEYTSKCSTIDDFSYKMVYEMGSYIHTDFMLLIHADGFVVHPECWLDEFLQYDYIGSPWPLPEDDFSYRDIHGNICRVGNSVSIRSKRLLDLPKKINIPWQADHGFFNEDGFICVANRHIFEEHGMTIAPLEVAKYFGHEQMIPEIKGIKPFVFHKWAGHNCLYPRFIFTKENDD